MKVASFKLAALALIATAAPALAQIASLNAVPSNFLAGAQVTSRPNGTLIVPGTSIARPDDGGRRVHTNTRIFIPAANGMAQATGITKAGSPPYAGYAYETPATLACIYGLVAMSSGCRPDVVTTNATGGSKVIAIVDAYHYPNAQADLAAYSARFGLPAPTTANFQQVNLGGSTVNDGWAQEAALDIQMAHAMAPGAKIILGEAASASFTDMLAAVDKANTLVTAAGGGQVSMSWGSNEFSGEATGDSHFAAVNVVYFASTGDNVAPNWPAVSAKVVAVGGTAIARDATLGFLGEDSWTDAGAGFSTQIPRPSFQPTTIGTMRGIPDIAAVAAPETGVWVYYTYSTASAGGWMIFGGTSVAAPLVAGIVNNSNHFYASSTAENTKIYAAKAAVASNFRIPRTGDCGNHHAYVVSTGWNPCTGVGSPINRNNQ